MKRLEAECGADAGKMDLHNAPKGNGQAWGRLEWPANLPTFPQMNGIFVLDKPEGPSSAQCLNIFKKLGQKKLGHAGTLDPFASGVLIVLLGQATKFAGRLLNNSRKVYRGRLCLGVETDTWDRTGQIVCRVESAAREDGVAAAIKDWEGRGSQAVPPFSAAKHNGVPLYKLARNGRPTPEKVKDIFVYEADLLAYDPPYVDFRVACSSGTYVRSLVHSLGKRLGCGAALYSLAREFCHPFDIARATTMGALAARPELLQERIVPVQDAFSELEKVPVSEQECARIKNGISIPAQSSPAKDGDEGLLLFKGCPVALAELRTGSRGRFWRIKRGLWTN